jgi:alkylation response protein AidB-like acyl-CoA dehydrogenase
MDLLPSQDQLDVAEAAAQVFAKEMPINALRERRGEPSAVNERGWAQASELGLFGLALPESLGGAGFGLPEESLVFREIGRRLAPGPILSTVLGARVAARAGDPDLTASIISGETIVGLVQHVDGEHDGARASGKLRLLDAVDVGYVLLIGPDGAGLIPAAELGELTSLTCIDPGARLAITESIDVTAGHWVPAADEALFQRGLVLAAAMLVGIAEACRDAAVEHAKVREQFGRPIGVNQAIKHACADMAMRAGAAFGQLLLGAASLASDRSDAEFQAISAKLIGDSAAKENAAHTVQVFGGMGFTFENDTHLYVKRAEVLGLILGHRTEHLSRLLALPSPQ